MLRIICRKQWPEVPLEELTEMATDKLLWGAFCYAQKQLDGLLEVTLPFEMYAFDNN